MIDIREDLRRAAGNAPPAPDLWDELEARVARVRRTRHRATVAAVVAAAVAVAAPFAINGNPLSPPTTANPAGPSLATPAGPSIAGSQVDLPMLRGLPAEWRASTLADARRSGVVLPSTGAGTWMAAPSGNSGVLLWSGAGTMGLPGASVEGPITFGRGEKLLQTDDRATGVAYLRVWPASGGDWLLAVKGDDSTRGRLLSDIALATLPAAFGSSPTDVTIDRLTVSVPVGCVVGPPEYVSPVRYGNAGLVTDGSTAATWTVSARLSGRMLLCGTSRVHIVVLRPLTPDEGIDLYKRMYATAADARGATSIEVPGVGAGFIERTDSANASTTILFGDMSGGFIASVGGGSSELLDAMLAGARLE